MTLDEAITGNEELRQDLLAKGLFLPITAEAIGLGIEAMKRLQETRKVLSGMCIDDDLLPGETDDKGEK